MPAYGQQPWAQTPPPQPVAYAPPAYQPPAPIYAPQAQGPAGVPYAPQSGGYQGQPASSSYGQAVAPMQASGPAPQSVGYQGPPTSSSYGQAAAPTGPEPSQQQPWGAQTVGPPSKTAPAGLLPPQACVQQLFVTKEGMSVVQQLEQLLEVSSLRNMSLQPAVCATVH